MSWEPFHVNTASTASGSGLTPCLSTILSEYFIESLFRRFAFQTSSLHAVEELIESVNVVCQGGRRYHYVIHAARYEIPVLPSVFERSPWHCTHRKASSSIGTSPIHMQIQFFSFLFSQRNLPEGRTQVQCSENLNITEFREALFYTWYR